MNGLRLINFASALLLLVFCIFILALSGCTKVKIKDDLWCVDTGIYGAECHKILSDYSITLDKYHWDKLRIGQVCSATDEPGRGFLNIKIALEKLCADTTRCSKEVREVLNQAAKIVEKNMIKAQASMQKSVNQK